MNGTWADFDAAPFNIWMGDPSTGLWCDECLLPSVMRVPLSSDPAVPPVADSEFYVQWCTECGTVQS